MAAVTTTAEPTQAPAVLPAVTTVRRPAATRSTGSTPLTGLQGLLSRARAHGLTGPAVVLLSLLFVAVGVAIDLRGEPSLGYGTAATFLISSAATPGVVRFRSLLTTLALPPLTFVIAAASLARLGGLDRGSRALVLDVGTTLALSAPLLVAGTGIALLVGLGRVVLRLAAARR